MQVAERHLRLDHVELGEVARRVRVLGAEGRAEGVDVGEREREDLRFQLPADREVGGLAEEVLREIGPALPRLERGDLEHAARALGVRRRDHRRVHVEEAALLEELVDRDRQRIAHPEDRAERVRARPQMADLAQGLERVLLLLQRIVLRDPPRRGP